MRLDETCNHLRAQCGEMAKEETRKRGKVQNREKTQRAPWVQVMRHDQPRVAPKKVERHLRYSEPSGRLGRWRVGRQKIRSALRPTRYEPPTPKLSPVKKASVPNGERMADQQTPPEKDRWRCSCVPSKNTVIRTVASVHLSRDSNGERVGKDLVVPATTSSNENERNMNMVHGAVGA